jgi:hypothetical protein
MEANFDANILADGTGTVSVVGRIDDCAQELTRMVINLPVREMGKRGRIRFNLANTSFGDGGMQVLKDMWCELCTRHYETEFINVDESFKPLFTDEGITFLVKTATTFATAAVTAA